MPIFLYVLILISLMTVFKYDSPKFHMSNGERALAVKSIHLFYPTEGSSRTAFRIYNYIKKTSTSDQPNVSLRQAYWSDERYTRASYVSLMIIVFSELTGFAAIMLYSNSMFSNIFGAHGAISPREGTYMIASVNFLASFMSIFTVRVLGRRALLLLGHAGVALCHFFIGVFILLDYGFGVLCMTCLFMVIYQNTVEPIGQVYVTEVCTDIALGVSTQTLWLVILIESIFTESLMDSWIQPCGVFFIFSLFSVLAVCFEYFYVAETRGLSERERKELYIPGAPYGRKLSRHEQMDVLASPNVS